MAKKTNMPSSDVMAGLSFGESVNEKTPVPAVEEAGKKPASEEKVQAPVPAAPSSAKEHEGKTSTPKENGDAPAVSNGANLAKNYANIFQPSSGRKVRFQAVLTMENAEMLDKLVAENKIKSRNDLINFLLNEYRKTLPN